MRHCKLLSFLLAVCLLLATLAAFAGCADKEPAKTDPAATTEATAATTAPPPVENAFYSVVKAQRYLKLIGRSQIYYGDILADWSASGIEFEYEGYGDLSVRIERSEEKNVVLVAEVDGEKSAVTVNKEGVADYRIASDLPNGTHHVLIRRRSMATYKKNDETATGMPIQFKGIQMTGRFLQKPADNKYKIAFLGDSITCGVGLENTDGLATYAVDFCTREHFDYDICCVTGIGVYRSTSQHGGKTNTMTKYYPYYNYYRGTDIAYNPTRKADLVIVNLNTNDQNTGSNSDETSYKATLKTLLSEIRAAHGENVKIVWVIGMMVSPDCRVNQWLNSVFDELGGESAGLYRITVDTDHSGTDKSHPGPSSHEAVSRALSAFIRQKNLLNVPTR